MVVIEPVTTPNEKEEEKKNLNLNPKPEPKPKSSTFEASSATTASTSSTLTADAADDGKATVETGYASEGFETASENELNDDNEDEGTETNSNDSNKPEHRRSQEQQNEEREEGEHSVPSKDDDTYNEDELKEIALAQANDAKSEGNKLFGNGQYDEALSLYEIALQVALEVPSSDEIRSMCHANRAACFFKLGKYEDTIKECTKALDLNPSYVKALLRRGEAREKLEHYEEAIADMTKILEVDPSHQQARRTIGRLKPLAEEKREKMKEEMIGKLKEMGNSFLGRFGMSIDNFKAVKDPNTGSYSVSFQS